MYDEMIEKKGQFYLVVSNYGYVLKTKSKTEFLEVAGWKGVIFAEVVDNKNILHYKIGQTIYKTSIASIKKSDSWEKDYCFDFQNLNLHNGNNIREVWMEERISSKL